MRLYIMFQHSSEATNSYSITNTNKIGQILKKYGIYKFKVEGKLTGGFINDVFLIKSKSRFYILKKRHCGTEKNLSENLELVNFLRKRGYPVINILPTFLGEYYIKDNNNTFELSSFISGENPGNKNLNKQAIKNAACLFASLDYTLANLPIYLPQYPKAKFFSKEEILTGLMLYENELKKKVRFRNKKILIDFISEMEKIISRDFLNVEMFQGLPQQVTHGNLSDNNIIINPTGSIAGIIDWDNIRIRPRIHSVSQQGLAFSGNLKQRDRFIQKYLFYIKEYCIYNKLSSEELECIPEIIHYRNLNVLWIFDHTVHFGQKKSINAIERIRNTLRWLDKNKNNFKKQLIGINS